MKSFKAPGYLHPINATHMRQMNRSLVLELIRQSSPVSRSEIARALNLSLPTIMRSVEELISEGLIRATGDSLRGTGRPREMLEYNQNGHCVIGVDLGGTKLYGAVASIGGKILDETHRAQHNSSGDDSFRLLRELIDSLAHSPRRGDIPIMGIAVGAPGVTHTRTGVVEWAPSLNWRDFPLKQRLEECFSCPVHVENDVNLAALGELWFGAGKGVNNMILLSIGTGMGAGLIVDGVIYRGHNESAGEVGYMVSNVNALGREYREFGAMESFVSGNGIAERGREALVAAGLRKRAESLTASEVFAAAREGEAWARRVVDDTADHLSITIVNLACLLDPELIVLGGGVANSGDVLIPAILERIRGVIPHVPRIEASVLGMRATVMGGVTMTVHSVKDYFVVRRMYGKEAE